MRLHRFCGLMHLPLYLFEIIDEPLSFSMKMIKIPAAITVFLCSIAHLFGQNPIAPTGSELRLNGFETRIKLTETSLAKNLEPRSIGPTIFSCRVTDIDVSPTDPTHFYVAYASGGLWKTESNGSDFTPIFDHEAVMTIGDIAVDWAKNVIWVGTGEVNSSRSSYAGAGMYRSGDGGKTWENRGLSETHHIGRVLLHPKNPENVLVAALGHLYSPNRERGIFKTTDGGKTWRNTLFINENTGAVDLIRDPSNPDILWAATWERDRRAWMFRGNGEGTGIYKSTDGGETWALVSGGNSGFPKGEKMGRIGLDIFQKNGKTILFAALDNQTPMPKKEDPDEDKYALKKELFKNIPLDNLLDLDNELLDEFLKKNDFPEKYDAKAVKSAVKSGKIAPTAIYDFLDAGDDGFQNTGIVSLEIYRSDDLGATWKRTHEANLDGVVYTYGYYFGVVKSAPDDPEKLYTMGVPIIKSVDGGKTWRALEDENVHADHHALWVNPERPGHLINGNDGGVNISYDDGKTWFKCNSPAVGQFYFINTDLAEPYNVYGGTQDNGVWTGSSRTEINRGWHDSGENPYKFLLGGDGMQVMIDPRDNSTVYTGSQFGQYYRLNKKTGDQKYITPSHDLGEKPLRWNWQSPIWLSKHNPDMLYMGANRLYRSLDKGENWEAISPDLTAGGQKGNVPFGTLTAVHESPLKFGLLYTGSDDGKVFCSKNGGENWLDISAGLPKNLWVSRIWASFHEKNRVYVSLNGYRWDDFGSYLFMSENNGETWSAIGTDLPAEPINVVKEDPVNPDLLFVGTDHGVYFTLNRGENFQKLSKKLPAVPVHDLVVQPKFNELVIGTHGRSLYVQPIKFLQQLTTEKLTEDLIVFEIPKKRWSANWGNQFNKYADLKEPELTVNFFTKVNKIINFSIKTKDGLVVKKGVINADSGLNAFIYNLDIDEKIKADLEKEINPKPSDKKEKKDRKTDKPIELKKADSGKFYLPKGTYSIELESGGKVVVKGFTLESGK